METFRSTIILIFIAVFSSCNNSRRTDKAISKTEKVLVYAKEPDDSADYKLLKYDFYLSKGGQLCGKKTCSGNG